MAGGGQRSSKPCPRPMTAAVPRSAPGKPWLEKVLLLLGLLHSHGFVCYCPGRSWCCQGLMFSCEMCLCVSSGRMGLSWDKLDAASEWFCWKSNDHQSPSNSQLVCLPKALKLVRQTALKVKSELTFPCIGSPWSPDCSKAGLGAEHPLRPPLSGARLGAFGCIPSQDTRSRAAPLFVAQPCRELTLGTGLPCRGIFREDKSDGRRKGSVPGSADSLIMFLV